MNRFSSWSGSLSSRSRSSSSSSCRSTSTWLRRARLTNIALTLRRISACSTATLTALRCTATNASASSPISSSERTTAGGTSIPVTRLSDGAQPVQRVGQLDLRDPQRLAAQQPHATGRWNGRSAARSAPRPAAPRRCRRPPAGCRAAARRWPRRPGVRRRRAPRSRAGAAAPAAAGWPPTTAPRTAPPARRRRRAGSSPPAGWPPRTPGSTEVWSYRRIWSAVAATRNAPSAVSCWARRSVRATWSSSAVPAGAGGRVELARGSARRAP